MALTSCAATAEPKPESLLSARGAFFALSVSHMDRHGILKIGFEVEDIDAVFASAKARNLDIFFPIVTPPGSRLRTFGLLDPDGNIVQFMGK